MKTTIDTSDRGRSEDVSDTLRRVQEHLEAGVPDRAIELLPSTAGDRLLQNARGVCLMRLGRIREAIELFRSLALRNGTLDLDRTQPPAFVVNFATAMLLESNAGGCLAVLTELGENGPPSAGRLREAIAAYRQGLGLWGRIQFSLYGILERPVELGFSPGELVFPGHEIPEVSGAA